MRVRIDPGHLLSGDVLHLHDWRLHIVAVEHDRGTAVLTEEFDFLLHFARHEAVEVDRPAVAA
jgi:hypothetical protein